MFRAASLRSGIFRINAPRLASTKAVGGTANGSLVPNNLLNSWYNTFGKSTSMYASWLVMLIVVGEYATGKMTDALWTMNNYGKTFATVDWSKFDQFDDEDEEEEDDDEDED